MAVACYKILEEYVHYFGKIFIVKLQEFEFLL